MKSRTIFILTAFLSIVSCKAQKYHNNIEKRKSTATPQSSIFFMPNTIDLDSVNKNVLDHFGKSFVEGTLNENDYTFYLEIVSNDKEITKDQYIDAKRVVYILNYLERHFKINKGIFNIVFFETHSYKGFIRYVIYKKNTKR